MPAPMVRYISANRKATERIRRLRSFGVSLSFKASSSASRLLVLFSSRLSPFMLAPYPASSTARIIEDGSAVPSTPMELVKRLTEAEVTPGTFATAFSTLAWQAAQLIPVTIYCFIYYTFLHLNHLLSART